MSINKLSSLSINDLAYQLKLQDISINSSGRKNEVVKPFKSPISQEMVLEYQKKMSQPVIINGQQYNFNPVPYSLRVQENDLESYIPLENELNEEEVINLKEEAKKLAIQINDLELKTLANLYKELNIAENYINQAIETESIQYKQTMEMVEYINDEINNVKSEIEIKQNELKAIQIELSRDNANKSINQSEFQRVKKYNQEKLRVYEEALQEANRGRINIQQQPNETEEEYLKRLDEFAMSPFDSERIEIEAELENIQDFKKNMKGIIRDETKIEAVLKSLDDDTLYLINKYFEIFKTEFLKQFGFDNKRLEADEIERIILSFMKTLGDSKNLQIQNITSISATPETTASSTGYSVSLPLSPTTTDEWVKIEGTNLSKKIVNNCLIIKNEEGGNELYLRLGNQPNSTIASTEGDFQNTYVKIDFKTKTIPKPNTFKYLFINYLYQNTNIPINSIRKEIAILFNRQSFDYINQVDVANFLEENGIDEKKSLYQKKGRIIARQELTQDTFGWGIQNKNIPKICQFGKIQILLDKLFYKNQLSIKDKSGHNIMGFNVVKVSDNFVKIIMKMCQNELVKSNEIDKLSKGEKELYDSLLFMAGLHKEKEHSIDKTIQNWKDQLDVLVGEIEAGNNNVELLKELKTILDKLVVLDALGFMEAQKYYKNMKSKYF